MILFTNLFVTIFFVFSSVAYSMGGGGNHYKSPLKEKESSFKSCRDQNIRLSEDGTQNSKCLQGSSHSFESLNKILKIGQVISFQNKLKDRVHTKIEFKIFETEMLEACSNNDSSWFKARYISELVQKQNCEKQLSQIRLGVRERFFLMRKHLALSSSHLLEDSFLNDKSSWYENKITHGMFSDFSTIQPLSEKEDLVIKNNYIEEISQLMLDADDKKPGSIRLSSIGTNIHNLKDIYETGSKNKTKKERLEEYLKNNKNVYSFTQMNDLRNQIQEKHKLEYFKLMNQLPLMGYIDDVNLDNPDSPSDKQLASSLLKTKNKLTKYLKKVKANSNETKWAEYAQFTPEIESLLNSNPEFCGAAETLLIVKSKEEKKELYEDLAIAAAASIPCFIGGPISETICIGAGVGIGGKGVVKAMSEEEMAGSRNLTDFLGEDGFSDFQALDLKSREIKIQAFLLPMGAWGKGAVKGKAVAGSIGAYKEAGAFITKGEGLDLANQAMTKLISIKNFDKLSVTDREIVFDKILADKVLPKHILSFLENKNGGFKLIDTNYDMDSIPLDIINSLTQKLGSKEAALKFVKETYHRHVLDHHGSLGNVQNATQQVLSEFSNKGLEVTSKCSNLLCKKAALKLAERNLQKEFFKVSTDNLGDGQLATYLIKYNAKEMLTDPNFVKFMDRVANIEDFESFGPGIYKKYKNYQSKLAKGTQLNSEDVQELNAINVSMARQKAINDTLTKYGADESLGSARFSLFYADRFHTLSPEVQKKLVQEVDELTKKILNDKIFRDKMSNEYVNKVFELSGTIENPGLIRQSEVAVKSTYEGLDSKSILSAKDEIFAFNSTKLRTDFQKANNGKVLGAFEAFHGPSPILGGDKKILVSISDTGEKRTFVVAFGNGLRQNDDSLKLIAKEIHLVEKRTLENLINISQDPEKVIILKKELETIISSIADPNIEKFGGPASFMRSAADDKNIKDLVFNFNGVRSSEADILEAVIRGRAAQAKLSLQGSNKVVRTKIFNEK